MFHPNVAYSGDRERPDRCIMITWIGDHERNEATLGQVRRDGE